MASLVVARIVFDIMGSLLILISMWNLQKHPVWWLVYIVGCLTFAGLFIITACPMSMLLELALVGVSIKNYRAAKRQK